MPATMFIYTIFFANSPPRVFRAARALSIWLTKAFGFGPKSRAPLTTLPNAGYQGGGLKGKLSSVFCSIVTGTCSQEHGAKLNICAEFSFWGTGECVKIRP